MLAASSSLTEHVSYTRSLTFDRWPDLAQITQARFEFRLRLLELRVGGRQVLELLYGTQLSARSCDSKGRVLMHACSGTREEPDEPLRLSQERQH